MRIADSVVGSVLVHVEGGSVFLFAGDEVPKGASVDDSLIEGKAEADEPVRKPKGRPKAAAGPSDSE